MTALERIWEILGLVFGGLLGSVERGVTAVFGSSNARTINRYQERVERINALEDRFAKLSDEELRGQTERFRQRLREGETLDDILEEAFAVAREGGKRFLSMRHYDVQLIGGMVLHSGAIAEMVTGEGKTLVATLPAYLNALEGKGVHVVTVNDYLARRDMEWMAPLYMNLGLTVGNIQSGMSIAEKQASYACDITYGTNNEFGFDYLRDNMRPASRGDHRFPTEVQQSQGPLHYAIIDEVDNILIDEARTPLIISGPADQDLGKYSEANRVAMQLRKEEHFTVDEKQHNVTLTDEGVREAEKLAGVESFYTAGNMQWPHLIDNALKAHYLYKLDVNYVVKERQIVIVDEFTGRLMEGRQWSDGLHQAVEAKEGVPIKQETQTFATVTLQNFFKLYNKLSGMTGTAMTEANEFWKIYQLDVVAIPPNRTLQRIEHPDVIYMTEKDKFKALAHDIERTNKWDVLVLKDGEELWGMIDSETDDSIVITPKGSKQKETVPRSKVVDIELARRPVLVGTVSIEKSERLSELLDKRGIQHEVLNAKQHGREADIVAQAGRLGAVTIATNMAGRGTDIILGGNPETMAWAQLQHKYPTRLEVPDEEWKTLVEEIDQREQMTAEGKIVREIGGLCVMGTERHDSRRIDLQLRGRCGRQGDPGSSRFYLSLEDDLMRIFAGDFVKSVFERLGMNEGEAIESKMVTRRIEAAQKKVEERNFEIRKSLLEYDEVMDEQRKRVYGYRQRILDGHSCRKMILSQIEQQIDQHVEEFLDENYGPTSYANWAGGQLGCQLEPRDYRGLDARTADQYSREQAERAAEAAVAEALEENLPPEMNEEEWNWQALATWSNKRYGTQYRDRDLKKLERIDLQDQLVRDAHEAIAKVDLDEGAPLLENDFGLRKLCGWIRNKFGIEATPAELEQLDELDEVKDLLFERASTAYATKEAEYPILTGISAYTYKEGNSIILDREGLAGWIEGRFGATIAHDQLDLNREALKNQLMAYSLPATEASAAKQKEANEKVEALYGDADDNTAARLAAGDEAVETFANWLESELGYRPPTDELGRMDRPAMIRAVEGAVDDRFHPEMRRMERQVLLSMVDGAWKDHLLAMDHLRSSVQLKSYAQLDPKVEYKREGMRMFEDMWSSIGERTTDLIFRMESFNEDFIRSTWVNASAHHAPAEPASNAASAGDAQQRAADNAGDTQRKPDPVRNTEPRVGRNDPCPCGSGKKYKACCMRKMV
ncbi:preprotein translocase subunit SecA [Roseimaritima sediminicola]|uniref:preprotein translocase subunit SecA n=1 Tax=Roseimaritima sediminicola TaxID=2662066 RepID=UPI0012984485|nr:preprotein translocase subunit SecA [Roseimaritima sediminicola]